MTRTRTSSDDIDLRAIGSAYSEGFAAPFDLVRHCGCRNVCGARLSCPRYQSEATLAIVSKGDVNPYSDPTRLNTVDSLTTRMDKEAIKTRTSAPSRAPTSPRRSFAT